MKQAFASIIFLLLFSGSKSWGQGKAIDSLKNVIQSQKEDSLKVNSLIALSTEYLDINPEDVINYGVEARDLAERIGYDKGLGYAYKAIARGFMLQANYPEATIQFQNSLKSFQSINFKPGIANILSNLGVIYFNVGDDTKALELDLEALRVSEEINDTLRIGTVLLNIGAIYNNKPATIYKGVEYFKRALPLFQAIDYKDGISVTYMNIGEIFHKKQEYDSAIQYFETSLEIDDASLAASFPLTHLGEIYAQKKDFKKALYYQHKAIKIAEKLGAKFEMIQAINGLAKTQKLMGENNQSFTSYIKARQLGEELNAKEELKTIYHALSQSYKESGDYKKAYEYQFLLNSINDSLYNSRDDKKIQQLQFNFDIEKKQNEIDLLTKDQALKNLSIQRQKVISYATAIIALLLLIAAVSMINRYRYIHRTNKIIQAEKARSDDLLLNILPAETAKELALYGSNKPRYYDSVSVLFSDFKGFSAIAGKLSPQELVAELNDFFVAFDEIIVHYKLEKIKTIGDSYMCAGGIPTPDTSHPLSTVRAAIAMQEYINGKNNERGTMGKPLWELRIGINTGPVVAGVVGKIKYAYDIWGDTVNIASRMESHGHPGRVNISSATYALIKDKYACEHRGRISAKNIGDVDMYFIEKELLNS